MVDFLPKLYLHMVNGLIFSQRKLTMLKVNQSLKAGKINYMK